MVVFPFSFFYLHIVASDNGRILYFYFRLYQLFIAKYSKNQVTLASIQRLFHELFFFLSIGIKDSTERFIITHAPIQPTELDPVHDSFMNCEKEMWFDILIEASLMH